MKLFAPRSSLQDCKVGRSAERVLCGGTDLYNRSYQLPAFWPFGASIEWRNGGNQAFEPRFDGMD